MTAPHALKDYYVPAVLVDPPFNSSTQTKTGPVYDIHAGTITYTVTNKTAAQLAAEKDASAETAVNDPIRESLVDVMLDVENRLSTLEGKPALTRDQVRSKVKAAIKARLP